MADLTKMAVKMRIGRLKKQIAAIKRSPVFKGSGYESFKGEVPILERELAEAAAKLKRL